MKRYLLGQNVDGKRDFGIGRGQRHLTETDNLRTCASTSSTHSLEIRSRETVFRHTVRGSNLGGPAYFDEIIGETLDIEFSVPDPSFFSRVEDQKMQIYTIEGPTISKTI